MKEKKPGKTVKSIKLNINHRATLVEKSQNMRNYPGDSDYINYLENIKADHD